MECYKCIHASHCQEPFPEEKCERFEEKITAETVMRLFEGMDPSAQKAALQFMRYMQRGGKNDTRQT